VGDKLVSLVEKNGIGVLIALTTIEVVESVVVKIGKNIVEKWRNVEDE